MIFAEMRTGSNFLETSLNASHGAALNPCFIRYPNRETLLDAAQEARDKDPAALLQKLLEDPDDLSGFRYFYDRDPRVLDVILDNRSCAKIIPMRNPAESYVSWKIARPTGQWKLTGVKRRVPSLTRRSSWNIWRRCRIFR